MPSQSYYYHYTRQLEVGRVDDRIVSYKVNNNGDAFMLQALKNEGNQEQQFTLLQQHGLYSEQKTSLPTAVHRQFGGLCFVIEKSRHEKRRLLQPRINFSLLRYFKQ